MRSGVGSLLQKRPREDSSAEEIMAAGPARVLPRRPVRAHETVGLTSYTLHIFIFV